MNFEISNTKRKYFSCEFLYRDLFRDRHWIIDIRSHIRLLGYYIILWRSFIGYWKCGFYWDYITIAMRSGSFNRISCRNSSWKPLRCKSTFYMETNGFLSAVIHCWNNFSDWSSEGDVILFPMAQSEGQRSVLRRNLNPFARLALYWHANRKLGLCFAFWRIPTDCGELYTTITHRWQHNVPSRNSTGKCPFYLCVITLFALPVSWSTSPRAQISRLKVSTKNPGKLLTSRPCSVQPILFITRPRYKYWFVLFLYLNCNLNFYD